MIIELREQLVHTNVSFATEISDIQETVSAGLTKFLDIVAEINELDYVPSEYINIGLIPPIVLMLQLIEMTLSSIGNISGVFQSLQMPVDPYFLLEKYVPYIDWESFKARAETYMSKTKTETDIVAGANADAQAAQNAAMGADMGGMPPEQPVQQ